MARCSAAEFKVAACRTAASANLLAPISGLKTWSDVKTAFDYWAERIAIQLANLQRQVDTEWTPAAVGASREPTFSQG